MSEYRAFFLILVSLAFSMLGGCAAVQTFPMAARAGDTITLALGSPEGMTTSNTTATFYSDSDPSTPIDLTGNITGLFKLFPDKTSNTWLMSLAAPTAFRSGHGPWLTVMTVDLPGGLALGTGKIRITAGPEVTYPRFNPHINDVEISLEVLPGTGSPNPLKYANFFGGTETGNLNKLKPLNQALVKPPAPSEGETLFPYGAIEIKINVSVQSLDGSTVVDDGIRVIMDDQPDHEASQLQRSWIRNGDEITVMLISPVGMSYYETRFSVVPLFPDYPYEIAGTPSLVSIKYYDLNGNVATGPTPQVELVQ